MTTDLYHIFTRIRTRAFKKMITPLHQVSVHSVLIILHVKYVMPVLFKFFEGNISLTMVKVSLPLTRITPIAPIRQVAWPVPQSYHPIPSIVLTYVFVSGQK